MKESYNAYDLKEVITRIEATQTSELTTSVPAENADEELTEVSPSKIPRCEEPLEEPMEGVLMLEAAGEPDDDDDDALEAACQARLACDPLLDFDLPRVRTRHRNSHRTRNTSQSQVVTSEHQCPAATSASSSSIAVKLSPARINPPVTDITGDSNTNAHNTKEHRTKKLADRRIKKAPQTAVLHSILKPAHTVLLYYYIKLVAIIVSLHYCIY